MDKGGGYVKCPRLSTRGGEGVKNGQNLVHVVVECPLTEKLFVFSQDSPTFIVTRDEHFLLQIDRCTYVLMYESKYN